MKPARFRTWRNLGVATPAMALVLAALVALFVGAGVADAQCPTCTDYFGCVDDFQPGSVCTANDVVIASMHVLSYKDGDSCQYAGDTAQVYLQATLEAGANERYDVSMFIALDGGSAQLPSRDLNGTSCYHDYLTPTSPAESPINGPGICYNVTTGSFTGVSCTGDNNCQSGEKCVWGHPEKGTGPFYNGEYITPTPIDVCGDIQQDVPTLYNLDVLTLPCEDANNDGLVDPISTCLGWDNQSNQTPVCRTVADAYPNTKSKCRCEDITVPELVIRKLIVDKVTIPASDPTEFTFEISGPTSPDEGPFTLADETTPYIFTNVLAQDGYSVTETVPPGWELDDAECVGISYATGEPVEKIYLPGDIDMTENIEVTCTFTNRKLPDWGDLPESGTWWIDWDNDGTADDYSYTANFCTTEAKDGARHTQDMASRIWLGTAIDSEVNGQPTQMANGDDSNGTIPDDEDGITLISPQWWQGGVVDGASLSATFNSNSADGSGSGYLVVWFDWNHDGVFTADEAMVNKTVTWTSATATQTFNFTVPFCSPDPNNCLPGNAPLDDPLFYRARLFVTDPTTQEVPAAEAFCGPATGGEVEDYYWKLDSPTAVQIEYFTATGDKRAVTLEWKTVSDVDTMGFNVYRAKKVDGPRTKLNTALIAADFGNNVGAVYTYEDTTVLGARSYYYWLETVDGSSATKLIGPEETRAKKLKFELAGGATVQ